MNAPPKSPTNRLRLCVDTTVRIGLVLSSICYFQTLTLEGATAKQEDKVAVGIGKADDETGEDAKEPTKSSSKDSDSESKSGGTKAAGSILEGRAEVIDLDSGAALRASKDYRKGCELLSKNNYSAAAALFKRAGDQFDRGYEKYRGEARYAEAQCYRMLNRKGAAMDAYRAAIELFKQYDPQNPYLKASVEQLGTLSSLRVQSAKMDSPPPLPRVLKGAINVATEITLRGQIKEDGKPMSGQNAVIDVDKKFIKDSVKQCFVEMTCLETAEIGSNSTNATNRWVPLMAYGKTVAVNATDDLTCPVINVKINGRPYSVSVSLPELGAALRTVLLVTDGAKICAIDPYSNDIWLLNMKFKKPNDKAVFNWKKLLHQKGSVTYYKQTKH